LKKLLLLTISSIFCIHANAQPNERYPIVFSQFYNFSALINPALLQTNHNINVTASNQFHRAPFNQIRTAIFDADIKIPHNQSKSILGVTFINDREGQLLRYTRAALRYGVHIPLNEKWYMSGGASLGFVNLSIDQTVSSGSISSFAPDIALGLAVYSDKTWIGFSSGQISNASLQVDISKVRLPRYYSIFLKRHFEISPFFKIIPSAVIRLRDSYYNPVLWDLNVNAQLQQYFLAGCGYSSSLGFNFNVGIHEYYFLSNPLSLTFSYNTGLASQVLAKIESFELTVRYSIIKKSNTETPE
jgi:type IX secretion system PorP/SprF family membrane protein